MRLDKIVLFLSLISLLISCTSALPLDPGTPGSSGKEGFAGKAFFSSLERSGYSRPSNFSISRDTLFRGENLTLSVRNDDYVYRYYYVSVNGQWNARTFPGRPVGNSNWLKTPAIVSFSTASLPEGDNYVVVYSCAKKKTVWDCRNNKWQIHQFKILPPPVVPPLNPQCGSDAECPLNYKCQNAQCVASPPAPIVPNFSPSYCGDDFSTLIKDQYLWSLDLEDLDEAGWISGWIEPVKIDGSKTFIPSFQLDSLIKHNGQRSLKISSNNTDTSGGISLHGGVVRVSPGETYTLSFWVKGENVVSLSGHLAIVHKTGKEIADGGISQQNSVYSFVPYPIQPSTYGWQQVVSNFTIPLNQDIAYVTIMFNNGAGTVWLDDMVVMPAASYNALSSTTFEVEARTSELGAPTRHYFLRDQIIHTKAVLKNQQNLSSTYGLKAELSYCGQILQTTQKTFQILPYQRADVSLLDIDPSTLELGDYLLNVTLMKNGSQLRSLLYPLGLRLEPQKDFVFALGVPASLNSSSAFSHLDKLKSYHLIPQFGEASTAYSADAALGRNMPFINRIIPHKTLSDLPKKAGILGEEFQSPYQYGISNPAIWAKAAAEISSTVRRINHYPAFFPRLLTSDDFSTFSGWDWNKNNTDRFIQLNSMNAPVPNEFVEIAPTITYVVSQISYPKGPVPINEPWLAWNRFLSKDVLGSYNKEVTNAVTNINPQADIGPIPGGAQWPLFNPYASMYPPYNFGPNGFNLLSYYMYLNYWRPELAYLYWSDIARMGNRDLPLYVMPDSGMPESSYHVNNFFILLAGGVEGLSYFTESWTTPEFWDLAQNKMGPIVTQYGSLFTQLEPEERKIGLVSSYTTANYNLGQPLHDLCAYINLLNVHADIEPVSEEELLAGRIHQYDALILSNVDWLRSDTYQLLSAGNSPSFPKILLDQDSEIGLSGNNIFPLNFKLVDPLCTGASYAGDYAVPQRINTIRAAVNNYVSPNVTIANDTVIYRMYKGGQAKYLWLVDVHTHDEYVALFNWMTYHGGYNNQTALNETLKYLEDQGIYSGTMQTQVSVKAPANMVAVDILSREIIPSSYTNGWINFTAEMGRLSGKLIALYPASPTSVSITIPSIIAGQQTVLNVTVLAGNTPLHAALPLQIQLFDPNGMVHPYSRFASTDVHGKYGLPIIIGTNAPKGSWTVNVTELSTGIHNKAAFVVN